MGSGWGAEVRPHLLISLVNKGTFSVFHPFRWGVAEKFRNTCINLCLRIEKKQEKHLDEIGTLVRVLNGISHNSACMQASCSLITNTISLSGTLSHQGENNGLFQT